MAEFKHSNIVMVKAEAFALRMVKLYKYLQQHDEFVMSKQVLRSGTSIGANITEGHYAASKADFINKYIIAEKEAAETLYWLRLLVKSSSLPDDDVSQSLITDCDELIRLLASSVKTTKENMERSSHRHS